ncbi:ABC transporter substrate-binding protein [Nocardia stercoris]|uniref:ABC transporter substrate-binding protein n=1 Tax=Nocardia stercoris TaxID=2483361 RepID=A0A3M2LCK0_9NOCA|nr:ABC transporter substrate-binding protein [Nocardia stercoris]RMI34303.1 ABC transporter substrate-binding protein [Nocardia stercoris]
MKHLPARLVAIAAAVALSATGCALQQDSGNTVEVVVGYQSKTINTVTAGTLLKAKGYLEQRLSQLTKDGGPKYHVTWQDYDTGAPITAQMVAEKIDIGSMGDYPLLINGSRTQANERAKTEFVSVTGYQPRGSLNMIVVKPDSTVQSVAELAGKKLSSSVGSASDGLLRQALSRNNIDPKSGAEVLNQQPQIGATALESGQVQALSQFVAWPGLLVFQNRAKALFDGGELNVPTFHGVVARRDYTRQHPEVLDAFLQAQLDATDFLHQQPLAAAQTVADSAGLAPEVVYLYNGPGGTSFDTPLKPQLIQAFKGDVPYLKSIGDFADLDIDKFVDDGPLRKVYNERSLNYDAAVANFANPAPITGTDPVTGAPVTDPAHASELWLDGQNTTQPAADPTSLLRAVQQARAQGKKVRAAYVPDAELGTRWFADKAIWLRDGATYLPFTTPAGAQRYTAQHPGAVAVSYDQAVTEVRA